MTKFRMTIGGRAAVGQGELAAAGTMSELELGITGDVSALWRARAASDQSATKVKRFRQKDDTGDEVASR